MNRQEDFEKEALDQFGDDEGFTPFVTGAEYGYQHAVKKVLKELFMIELSNFFPELDEVNTTVGQQRLIEFIKQAMEE